MAQHIPIENFKQKAIRKIEQSIRKQKYFNTSMKYQNIPVEDDNPYTLDAVYVTHRRVPENIVAGGRASFEVHTRAGKIIDIFLVA